MDESQELLQRSKLTAKQQQAKADLLAAGNEAFDAEKYERALECFHRASVIDGSDAEVWSSLGLTYANLDFPQEAWRSYKLALYNDPEHRDTLWYAGEFLFNMEDFELAKLLLERYIRVEGDESRREEAREILTEVNLQLGVDEDQSTLLESVEAADELEEDQEVPEGFVVDDEAGDEGVWEDEDADYDDEELSLEEGEGGFIASLNLELTGMKATCSHCAAGLPQDAPYCYSCKMPHFYEEQ